MKNNFKSSPKRYHPKGLSILYEDKSIIVVDKMCGLLTVGTERIKENTAYYRLNNYVKKGNYKSRNRVFIVHRLDKDTSGVLIFAKNGNTKRYLQEAWHGFKKMYNALILGHLQEKEGVITSYLAENQAYKMYSVNDPKKGKLARTGYKVIRESKKYSLIEIELLTGRKNQIRVHFSEKGTPVVGDKKYGTNNKGFKRLALHSTSIIIIHPVTKETMTFKTNIPAYFKSLLNN